MFLNMGDCGQISLEFMMLVGFSFVLLFPIVFSLYDANELNQAMASVRAGSLDGEIYDSFSIYPDETFKEYYMDHPRLLNPSIVKITKVNYLNQGYNSTYKKTKIQLRIHASSPDIIDKNERNCLGDRINYCARKKICETFQTENLTNSAYNPAFSNRYVFTTADVIWD